MTKYLTVSLFNAGSLGTRHDELLVAMESLSPDILAINETWLRKGEERRAPSPPGYTLRHIPRPPDQMRARGGGVGFYIRKGLVVRTCSHPIPATHIDQMWISLRANSTRLLIGTAYRPPWLSVDTFFDALTESLATFSNFDHTILLGDFNIDYNDVDLGKRKKLIEFLRYFSLINHVAEPTHFTTHSQTLIDLVCSDTNVLDVHVDHITELGAHAFITVCFKIKKKKKSKKTFTYRPLKDIDLAKFNKDLLLSNISDVLGYHRVDAMVSTFTNIVTELLDLHAPIRSLTLRDYLTPWISNNTRLMMQERNDAKKKYRSSGRDEHNEYYKELKKSVELCLHGERKAYFDWYINGNINKPKILWKNLKRAVLPDTKRSQEIPQHLLDPESINLHFLDVPGGSAVSISDLTYFEWNNKFPQEFKLGRVTEDVVGKIILSIKSNAQGVDRLSRDMILLTLPHSLPIITAIINTSIDSRIFPSLWKTALVRPIPKNPNPSAFKDLRPISLLPYLSKILEKVVYDQVLKYCEDLNILPDLQSGFRRGRSTSTALLEVIDNVLSCRDGGSASILVLLDYSRAFDSINIPMLLAKMSYYGFHKSTVEWFDSYLTDRSQRVEINALDGTSLTSQDRLVYRGVPQGSILGPLLFILYTADIPNSINSCKYHLYADDLQLYLPIRVSDFGVAIDKLNQDLSRIALWSARNCLMLNPSKTKYLVLGSERQIQKVIALNPVITIQGVDIERVDEARNLGILMDGRLRFENFVLETIRNCFYRLKVLYRIRDNISQDLRVLLCDALVLSKLNYGIVVYGPCLLAKSKVLVQRVQNACARYCFKIPPRQHVTPYLHGTKILRMCDRLKLYTASLLFGVVNRKTPNYLFNKLIFRSSSRIRSCAPVLEIPQYNTTAFRGSFRYNASKIWNNIPPPIRNIKTIGTFKKKYKTYLLQSYNTYFLLMHYYLKYFFFKILSI